MLMDLKFQEIINMSKITVSFKNTKKDKELFEVLNNLEEVKKENLKVDISDFQ